MRAGSGQPGFTLVEVMVSMLLGFFLLGGILQVFSNSKKNYRLQEGLTAVLDNGRFAMDYLTTDIRMAGFIGCSSQTAITNTLNTADHFSYRFDRAIEGFEAISAKAWMPTLPSGTPTAITAPLGGSDIITLRRVGEQDFKVTAHASANADISLDAGATATNLKAAGFLKASNGANDCALAAVTDCSSAAIFQVTGVSNDKGRVLAHATTGACKPKNATTDLGKTYQNGQLWPIHTISYYIRVNPGNQPALYKKINDGDAEELVEGIEQMQVLYGVDNDSIPDAIPNYYVNAASVTDWDKVRSVRISLLVVSIEDNLTDKPIGYTYNGISSVGDRHLRRIFTTTIGIRNKQA